MNGFDFYTLKELTSRIKVGFVGSVNQHYCDSEVGIPIIRTTDINNIDFNKTKHVTKDFHEKNKKSQLTKGDLIIARHGENGNAVIYRHDRSAQVLNAVIVVPDPRKVDSDLLKIFFDSPYVKKQISGSVKGSVQGVVNTKHISDLILNISKDIDYKFVTSIISNIDKKIELNNKINAELEAMAKLIYDYWFVQFDFPDANGKPYKSSGGKMVYNEALKWEIPEGWEVNNLEKAAVFKNGKGFKKTQLIQNGKYEVFGSNGVVGRTDSILFKDPVIAIGRVGANYGEVHYSLKPCWISDNAVTAQPVRAEWYWWLLLTLRMIDYSSISGGSAQPLITQGKLKALECALPNKLVMSAFHSYTDTLFLEIQNMKAQNEDLTSLRDWLLPLLMNGQVTIAPPKSNNP